VLTEAGIAVSAIIAFVGAAIPDRRSTQVLAD